MDDGEYPTLDDMRPFFQHNQLRAAAELGVSKSVLQERANSYGIVIWPNVRLATLNRLIMTNQSNSHLINELRKLEYDGIVQGQLRFRAQNRKMLTLDDLRPYFRLKGTDAARLLGVCVTVLKLNARAVGVPRWPHRAIISLEHRIASLKRLNKPRNLRMEYELDCWLTNGSFDRAFKRYTPVRSVQKRPTDIVKSSSPVSTPPQPQIANIYDLLAAFEKVYNNHQ